MGLLQSAAERSERKTINMLARAISDFGHLECGPVAIVCHIEPAETHHGIWVGQSGLRTVSSSQHGPGWVGVYRCQGHFWGITLTSAEIADVVGKPDSLVPYMHIAALTGHSWREVSDLGLMKLGVWSLAAALAGIDYESFGEEAPISDALTLEVTPSTEAELGLGGVAQQAEDDQTSILHFEGLNWYDNGEVDWGFFEVQYSEDDLRDPADVPSGRSDVRADESAASSIFHAFDELADLEGIAIDIVEVRGRLNAFGKPKSPPNYDAVRLTFFEGDPSDYLNPLWADMYPYASLWRITYTTDPIEGREDPEPDDTSTYLTTRASGLEAATAMVEQLLMYARDQQFVDLEAEYPRFQFRLDGFQQVADLERGTRIARSCRRWLERKMAAADLSINERAMLLRVIAQDEEHVRRTIY